MAAKAKRAVKLFGTEVPDAKRRTLRAGALSAVLDNGALRTIKFNDVEVLRAIAFLVRDENWGTYTPAISGLKVKETPDGFSVRYSARCADAKGAIAYRAEIEASVKGTLSFKASATPETDFRTNRTGFIVLHPLRGVAGQPVTVEHVNGQKRKRRFPALIDPVQPFLDVRALTHTVMPGIDATARMEGDAFETEDHRNWTDASFKTYVRPLALSWPYTLAKDQAFDQSVTLTLSGKLPKPKKAGAAKPIAVTIGRTAGTIPSIGVGIPMQEIAASLAEAETIKAAGIKHLVCRIDGRAGTNVRAIASLKELAERTGAHLDLEIVIPGKEAPADELASIAADVAGVGLAPASVTVSPAADLKAVLPGSEGGDGPTFKDIIAATRAAFPGAAIGGGMFSFFTELNRKRPPAELVDFVTHTTSPIVHAADDLSVMETLEALPDVIKSTKAFIGKKPYRIGPSAIPARDNPYGAASAANPDNGRVCLAETDPRQRGLFAAAWTLGYVAAFAAGGIAAIALGAATGPQGMIARKASAARPWYDDDKTARFYPVYHVIAGLAPASGAKRIAATSAEPAKIAALAHATKAGPVLWLANLTGDVQRVKVVGLTGAVRIAVLDEASFERAARDPMILHKITSLKKGAITLGPYAVARISCT